MMMFRSGKSWVSCLIGVLINGQCASQCTQKPHLVVGKRIISNDPGTSAGG